MPVYNCKCLKCGHVGEQFMLPSGSPEPCAKCGGAAERQFTPGSSMLIPPYMSASFKTSAMHDQWFNSDETQARIKKGELEPYRKSQDPHQ
jgi:hypothetical protein